MLAAQLNMEAAAADREVELLQTVEEMIEELLPLMEAAGEARQEAESAAKQAQEVQACLVVLQRLDHCKH